MDWNVELVLVATVAILPSVVGSLLTLLQPETTRRRLDAIGAFQISVFRFLQSTGGIAVICLVALYQPDGLASVGLRLGRGHIVGEAIFGSLVVVGSISAAALIVAILLRVWRRPKKEEDMWSGLPAELAYQKSRWDRLLYATVMPFSAIAEEMTYRGYLVRLLGEGTGDLALWIMLSIGLTITIHLYQGVRARVILFHSAFAGLMIWLTLYTGGIEGPIVIHALLNTMSFVRSWRAADRAGTRAETEAGPPRGFRRLGYVVFIAMNLVLLTSLGCSMVLIFR